MTLMTELSVSNEPNLEMCTSLLARNFLQKSWTRTLLTSGHLLGSESATNKDEPQLEVREISKDRTKEVPVETSIRYLKSAAYKQTYGDQPVWVLYRRNHKGALPPRKTRRTCVRGGQISCGNPCPICRDEYLVLNENNVELLKQFISPHTGSILGYSKTGLCQKKHEELLISIKRAFDCGLITFDVPHRQYDYSEYYPEVK